MGNTKYMSRISGEIFEDEEEVIEHLKKEGIVEGFDLYYDEFEEEELSEIDDTPESEEILDEEEGLTEEEARGVVVLANWNEIEDEELKKIILSLAMGDETGSSKKLSENVGTRGAIPYSIKRTLQKLSDPNSRVCPFCYKEISMEEISTEDNLTAKILHAKREHKEILSAYSKIVGVPTERDAFETEAPTREEPESGELLPHQKGSPNPEQCSEELSKEELTKKVVECPELREALYRKWLEKLQKREE